MASPTDNLRCNCLAGKAVTSYCKKHLQPLCMDCLLSKHKDCIADIITIEAANRNTHTLWNEIVTKCENYKIMYEKQKSKKEEIYQKMEAMDKEFRTTISKMRLEMIKRINLVCKNALELSVSVMSHRVSASKSDVERLDQMLQKLGTLELVAEERNRQGNNNEELIMGIEEASKELAVIEAEFEKIHKERKEVNIQFVVPPIVTDFMEYFNSLGEIIEEAKESGRASLYLSDKDKRDIRSRTRIQPSHNPFKALKSNADRQNFTDETKDEENGLFIFQKGLYNHDDRNPYAYIDVHRSGEVTPDEPNVSSDDETFPKIPPLPTKSPTPCKNLNMLGYECPDAFRTFDRVDATAEDKFNTDHNFLSGRPVPKPRLKVGKDTRDVRPKEVTEPQSKCEKTKFTLDDELSNQRLAILQNSGRHSTSSDISRLNLRTEETDSGIIVLTDDRYQHKRSSHVDEPPFTPAQFKNGMYRDFPGPEFRGSDPTLHIKDNKEPFSSVAPLNYSQSMGRTRVPSGERDSTIQKYTFPYNTTSKLDLHTNIHNSESDTDAANAIEELDRVLSNPQDDEDKISSGSIASSGSGCVGLGSTTAMSTIELQIHQKNIKDVCIITSIAVTENKFLIVCDYSHNCIQIYDTLGHRRQIYGLAKPFGLCLLQGNAIAVTSRNRSSVNVFNLEGGFIQFENEHRLGNLVNVFGLSYSKGFVCVCCLTHLVLFTEDLRPYRSVKAINGTESKGTLSRKKATKPLFSGVKYCAIDFTGTSKDIYASDFKQDRIVHMNIDGEVYWILSVKDPKSIALNQGKLYVAAKKQIVIIDTAKGAIQREVHEGVPKYPWALFIDDATSTMLITNGSINDAESRKIQALPIKILTMIFG